MDENQRVRELEAQVASLQRALDASRGGHATQGELVERVLHDRTVLENLPDLVAVLDREYRILYLNHTVPQGITRQSIGSSVLDVVPEAQHASYRQLFSQAWDSGKPCSFELRTVSDLWWESRLIPIRSGEHVALMLSTAANITERKRAEQALRESESRLRVALHATGMGTWTWNIESNELSWDAAACAILGIDPAQEPALRPVRDFIALVHVDDRERVREAFARCLDEGTYSELEHRVVAANGAVRHVLSKGSVLRSDNGFMLGVRGGLLDITDRKRLEEQLNLSAKMEAIGQLTAGVAHNFNNLLSVIVPNVGLARFSTGSELAVCLDDIEHAAHRATDLIKQLMLFARGSDGARRDRVDLAALAQRTAQFCRTTFRRGITIELALDDAAPEVSASPGQIEQVLLNICLNARDAFDDASTAFPRLTLSVQTTPSGARVSVTDNGPGMDESVRTRVFEPFYTTKVVGRGTGLGLASAYAIITEHHGRIDCHSERGVGTTFSFELPRAGAQHPRVALFTTPATTPLPRGHETVLLVEDEPLVRKTTSAMLAFGGYGVLTANDGQQAIELLSQQPHGVDIVLLDGSMPGAPSSEVAARLRALDSAVPLLLLSGNPNAAFPAGLVAAALTKPVDAETLFRAIRQALAARGADATGTK